MTRLSTAGDMQDTDDSMLQNEATLYEHIRLQADKGQSLLHVDKFLLRHGAKFIVAVCGGMMLMPGLPKVPAAANMKYINGEIEGLF